MVNEPRVSVTCDKCGYEEDFEMCAIVRNAYDNRYLPDKLKRAGWETPDGIDGVTICQNCVEESAEGSEE